MISLTKLSLPPVPIPAKDGSTDTLFGRGLIALLVLRVRLTGTVPPSMPLVGLALLFLLLSIACASVGPTVEVELPVE